MSKPMMKCGHVANATSNGKPVCVICIGIVPGANEIAPTIDLTGRKARCAYKPAHGEVDSSTDLAFFEHTPGKPFDNYYCGCRGWD